ncbi:MAG TPA: 2-oxoglutarate dehydrogenase, E2 component, dihydrolipoamide succinyltransferase [Ornithinimicrobium sp.]|uniref:2-oxoglutarate dehydrogenase, E2 component, dihydrolipoamide succinyltransferase n=1 Tax=Ornithinimicrobium sp. TaxID=1977084 RepID=UPI002B48ECAE|nr:2-oxoglutarate dehydrogenase, E2 component, dihydrolipoamide succinyltransferase [Ornithinimicrobium sp.]HKJ11920.1 2-oxoglutarate dehydrogenase, E2 component, dihydrolipoamide succinyltransferase [Ornithinimicrobium sp.]
MSERVSMPALGESVTEGTVTRWLKSVGDEVEVDEPLLEVSTDKVDTEIPSPVAGTLQEILAEEDDTVEVGADLAVIGDGSDNGGSGQDSGDTEEDTSDSTEEQDTSDSSGEQDERDGDADDAAGDEDEEDDQQADGTDDSGAQEEQASAGSGSQEGETVTMPALGESVTEGTVTRWLKQEGDDVEVDEPLLEVSTDKVDTEIPSPVAGKLTKVLAAEDDTVEVGGELAVIGGEEGSSGSGEQEQSGTDEAAEADDAGAQDEADDESQDDDGDLASEQKLHEESEQESQGSGEHEGGSTADDADSGGQRAEEGGEGTEAGSSGSSGSPEQESSTGGSSDVGAYVTPLVRKLAAKHDVDLESLEGTGVGGRIRKQDVLEAAKKAQEAEAEPEGEPEPAAQESSAPVPSSGGPSEEAAAKRGTTEKMSRLRKVIATRMVESLQVSAQLTTVVEVDVTKVARLRAAVKDDFAAREGVKLSFMPFFALAAVEALKQHPNVNASIDEDQIAYHAQENLGIAVDTEKGLIVPVIKEAGDLNIAGLARKIADLAERTRTNKISPEELGGGTFTLTNTGSRGALFDTPILNQPQVGILGTGAVVRRPVVVADADGGESIAVRSMVYLALTYDHRIVDGADAARFLSTIKARLEEASFEV